ncbi:MAG: aldehyde ferredoxin oxidoreductase N-terminal domain-containing protein, partial [Desulfobacterales bacterium]
MPSKYRSLRHVFDNTGVESSQEVKLFYILTFACNCDWKLCCYQIIQNLQEATMRYNSYSGLFGYAGKLLRVNLTDEKIVVEEISHEILRKFMGGVGYGAKLLYDELSPGIDPLGPENKIIFSTGPLTGTKAPGSGFHELCFKSPLTGIWGESRSGGE